MKNLFAILLVACSLMVASTSNAQDFPKADASIMDMAYFPARSAFYYFAKNDEEREARTKKLRVTYSRPAKKGRQIFGDNRPPWSDILTGSQTNLRNEREKFVNF